MKIYTALAILVLIFSCKKSVSPTTPIPQLVSKWIINGTTYESGTTSSPYGIFQYLNYLNNDSANSISVLFQVTPTKSFTYKVVDGVIADTLSCNINVIIAGLAGGNNTYYTSVGNNGDSVYVTVNGGKTVFSFNDIALQTTYNTTNYDTSSVSGLLVAN